MSMFPLASSTYSVGGIVNGVCSIMQPMLAVIGGVQAPWRYFDTLRPGLVLSKMSPSAARSVSSSDGWWRQRGPRRCWNNFRKTRK